MTNHNDSGLHRHPTTARGFAETVNRDLRDPELSTVALTQFEAEIRFRARASQGSVATGLQLLEKLDALTGEELEQR